MKQASYQHKSFFTSAALTLLVVALIYGFSPVAIHAQEHEMKPSGKKSDHIMVKPENVKWTEGLASIPAGARFAVIEGDPKVAGLFTMRLWFPADYKIAAHWHPADEHITVISGTFQMGLGDKFDNEKLQPLPAGSFAIMASGTRHFAMTKEETVIQLHGMGPWGINYVNPADDPRKK
jgi:quercetin dioxygenase-like cupin family protein